MQQPNISPDLWLPERLQDSICFSNLRDYLQPFIGLADWPDLKQYQAYLDNAPQPIKSSPLQLLRVVAQAEKSSSFEQRYLP